MLDLSNPFIDLTSYVFFFLFLSLFLSPKVNGTLRDPTYVEMNPNTFLENTILHKIELLAHAKKRILE